VTQVDSVLDKALRVLRHAELFEPVPDLLHCGAASHSTSGEHIRLRGCRPFRPRRSATGNGRVGSPRVPRFPRRQPRPVPGAFSHRAMVVETVSPAKVKDTWSTWRNKPYAASRSDEYQRREELWQAFCDFVRLERGWITSPIGGRSATLETEIGSELPQRLRELGYHVAFVCQETRVTGASPSPETERLMRKGYEVGTPPSPFMQVNKYELTLPWMPPPSPMKRPPV
jgi:hypothetical protein